MPKTYTTIQGDMFDGIAKKMYDDEAGCVKIMEANPKHMRTVIFPANVELVIPDYARTTAKKQPPWRA